LKIPAARKKVSFSMRGRPGLTKKRHLIDILIKRARKGGREAKDKLYKEFGIRVYSSEEVEEYVSEKLKTEMVSNSLPGVRTKTVTKAGSKKKNKLVLKKK
jgi:hypothetical protein